MLLSSYLHFVYQINDEIITDDFELGISPRVFSTIPYTYTYYSALFSGMANCCAHTLFSNIAISHFITYHWHSTEECMTDRLARFNLHELVSVGKYCPYRTQFARSL